MRIASEQFRPATPSLSSAQIVILRSGVHVQHHLLLIVLQHPHDHPSCGCILHLSALGQHSAFFRFGTAFVSLLCGSGCHLPVLGKPHWPAYSAASLFIGSGDISGACDLWQHCALSSFALVGEVGCSGKVVVSACVYGLCPGSFASSSVLCGAASVLCATTFSAEYDGAYSSAGVAAYSSWSSSCQDAASCVHCEVHLLGAV